MFHFENIEYLFALLAVPVLLALFYLLLKWKKKAEKKIGDPALVKQLISGFSATRFAFKFLLVIIAFALCAFAAAGLLKPEGTQKINKTGIDVMVALDVSNSMLADDIKPSRLERAKQIVVKIIDKLNENRIGLVIFAGKAYVQMPITTDHSAAKMYLSAISPDDIPTQGTVISQALKTSYAAFNAKEKKYRAIILITDGEDHDEEAIKITRQLAEDGVMVNTIGIGSPEGALIKDKETNEYKKDESGNNIVTRLNEDELKKIAQNGNGLYQLFTSTEDVADNLQKKLSGLGRTTSSETAFATYKNYFWYFLLCALVLLVIEFFIPEGNDGVKKRALKTAAILTVMLSIAGVSVAQKPNKQIIAGNEAYKKNQFNKAAALYQKVLEKEPGNKIAAFNLGNALYKSDKPDEAIKVYDDAIRNIKDKSFAESMFYNKGVALQKQNSLPECITAYKNALKLIPQDEDARQNLERALLQLKQQQKQQDQKKNNDNKQQQKQEPKPQPSKITKSDAEEKLKALAEHEKSLQEKLRKVKSSAPDQPKKDW